MAGRKRALILGGVALAGLSLWLGLRSVHVGSYRFLEGHAPITESIWGPIEDGSHETSEVALYTWEADYGELVKEVGRELEPRGYQDALISPPAICWSRSDGSSVYVEPGRAQTPNVQMPHVEKVPGWVTVTIGHRAPDNLITKLRVLLFSESAP